MQISEKGHFRPIGSNGFYRRGGVRANFDQQPIEAQATVSACLEAYRATSDFWWYEQAQRAFDWFLGWNDLGLELYSPESGGCRDGLHVDRVNGNQGAESTLAFLLSLAEMRLAQNMVTSFKEPIAIGAVNSSMNAKLDSRQTHQHDPQAGPVTGPLPTLQSGRFAAGGPDNRPDHGTPGGNGRRSPASRSPRSSPSDTSRSTIVFRNASSRCARCCSPTRDLSEQRRLLIGSYFLAEYSLESAALFNPSDRAASRPD